MKITQILSRDGWTPNRDVNKEHPKYGARMLITVTDGKKQELSVIRRHQPHCWVGLRLYFSTT